MSTRAVLQSIIDSNVYDNNNKEILASMMRTVLEALMNSDFNKDDDQLQNLKYDASKTLAQQFALLPIIQEAVIGPFDFGGSGTESVDVQGVAVSCIKTNNTNKGMFYIIFPPELNILNKKIIINYYIDNPSFSRLQQHGNMASPVYGFFSDTELRVVIREVDSFTQDMYLKIYII